MTPTIRRAEDRDTDRILELLRQVCSVHSDGRPDLFRKGGTKYSREELAILFHDDTRPVFVAVDDRDEVLGYCFCIFIEYSGNGALHDRRELYIDDLCVDREKRRLGVGALLYDHAKDFAKEAGCYHMTLNVWACNQGAMAFYESRGMRMLKKEMEVIL
ncbi:MAG: GNAT family N-acetyltransferase [Lachnospiraceae bacterium]|nr:GNAT family N-acetyltransferase [Lachnospiraceae bacterium]